MVITILHCKMNGFNIHLEKKTPYTYLNDEKYEASLVFSKSPFLRGVKRGDFPPLEVQQLDMYAYIIDIKLDEF